MSPAEPQSASTVLTDPHRLLRIAETELFDSAAEEGFDRLAKLAARLLGTPTALVSLVDDRRQYFKAFVGLSGPVASSRQTPLSHSFCKTVVVTSEPLIIENALTDPRVAGNLAISDLGVMAYLGIPIYLPTGEVIGSFCVIDDKPRPWSVSDVSTLADLASAVESEISLKLKAKQLNEVAKEAQRREEERSTLLNAIGEGVYGVDNEGRCTFANRAALETLGYQLDDVLGQDMHALIHYKYTDGSPYPKDDCPMLRAIRTGQAVRLENETLWRQDGSCFLVEYCSYPILQNGAVVGSLLTFSDMAVRDDSQKRMAVQYAVSQVLMEVRRPEEVYFEVLAAIGTAVGWSAGAFWVVEETKSRLECKAFWSRSGASLNALGASPEALTLAPGEELSGQVWKSGSSLAVELTKPPELLRNAPPDVRSHRAAFAFPVKADGETLGVLQFLTDAKRDPSEPLLQSISALGGTLGQFLKRIRTEDALRVSKRAIEAVNVGVTISDATEADMPLVYCNAAFERITGYSSTESIGRNCRFLQGSDTDEDILQELRDGLSAKTSGQYVLKNYRADGSVFWNELTISPVTDASGSLTHFVGVQADITERISSEAALVEAKRLVDEASDAKSQFIANMSHELRTPLSAIIGYAELLDEEAEDLGDAAALLRSDIGKVHSAAHHLLNLINGVLDISKIEAGKMELELEEFSLIALTQEVVETVSTLVREKNNILTVEVSPDIDPMFSDRMRIKQCLINLLSNAAKFTTGGEITLGVVKEDGDIKFKVSDTGVGMSDAQVAKLFSRFSQADASTTRQFGGTGLGLALTKEFASLLGGEISVQSAEGKGTIFELALPTRAKICVDTADVQTDPFPLAEHSRGLNIVVIDDDPLQRDLIGRFLIRQGFTVAFAADGLEGIRLSKQLRPSAILLDVHMPLMNGWSVLTALKDSPQTSSIPVIMITVEHDRARGMALGADDYLTKPVDWKRLHRALINHIPPGAIRSAGLFEGKHSNNQDLEACLASQGWDVRSVRSKAEARNLIETHTVSLYVVDLQQTGADGLDFISELQNLPGNETRTIIALTSGDAEAVSTSTKGRESLLDPGVISNGLIDEIQRCVTAQVKRDD